MAEVKGNATVRDKLTVDGNAKFQKGLDSPYMELIDQKGPNTAGGTFTEGAWRTRDLTNTIHNDIASTVTLAASAGDGGQFIIPAGTYYIEASVPATEVEEHAGRLADVTDAAGQFGDTVVTGTVEYAADSSLWRGDGNQVGASPGDPGVLDTASSSQSRSNIEGRFSLTRTTTLEVQHRSKATKSINGFGRAAGFYLTNNIYTIVKLWQIKEGA